MLSYLLIIFSPSLRNIAIHNNVVHPVITEHYISIEKIRKNRYRLVNWDRRNLNYLLAVAQWCSGWTKHVTQQLWFTGHLVSSRSLLKTLEAIQRNHNPLEVCSGILDWKTCDGTDFEAYCLSSASVFTYIFHMPFLYKQKMLPSSGLLLLHKQSRRFCHCAERLRALLYLFSDRRLGKVQTI